MVLMRSDRYGWLALSALHRPSRLNCAWLKKKEFPRFAISKVAGLAVWDVFATHIVKMRKWRGKGRTRFSTLPRPWKSACNIQETDRSSYTCVQSFGQVIYDDISLPIVLPRVLQGSPWLSGVQGSRARHSMRSARPL